MKRSIIGGDLNLCNVDWNGHTEKFKGTHVFLNRRMGKWFTLR
jgi:hypothetical protein